MVRSRLTQRIRKAGGPGGPPRLGRSERSASKSGGGPPSQNTPVTRGAATGRTPPLGAPAPDQTNHNGGGPGAPPPFASMSALLVEECLRPSQPISERESLDVVEASAHGSEDDGLGPQVGRAHIRDS